METKQVDLDTDMQRSMAHQADAERERPRQERTTSNGKRGNSLIYIRKKFFGKTSDLKFAILETEDNHPFRIVLITLEGGKYATQWEK
jgi:hypothetical protein